MFGHNDYGAMMKKGKWDKLDNIIYKGDPEELIKIAEACGEHEGDETRNMLVLLISNSDPRVQLQAVLAMEKIGNDVSLSHIRKLAAKVGDDNPELKEAIKHASLKLNSVSKDF